MRSFKATVVVLVVVAVVFCGILLGACVRSGPSASEPPPQALSDSALTERASTFIGLLVEGKYDEAVKMMDRKMANALPSGKLREAWGSLVGQVGSFQSTAGSRLTVEAGYKVVYVTCQFKNAAVEIKVVMDAAGNVAGLWFGPPR